MACPQCTSFVAVAEPAETLTDFLDDGVARRQAARVKSCPMCGEKNPLSAGECKACGEPLTPYASTTQGQVWRDGKILVMTKGAELPNRCIKTNEEAETRLRRTLYWHPRWVYALVAASPLIYIIVALVLRQKADVELPLCRRIRRRRWFALLWAWIFGLTMFPLLIAGIVLSEPRSLGDAGIFIGLGSFIAAFVGLIISLSIGSLVSPTKIDKQQARLKGAHPDYLALLPAWPGDF